MHYKNKRLAHVGDPVIGTTYNHKGIIAGTLVSITPGPDNCSAMVGFLVTVKAEGNVLPGPGAYGKDVQYGGTPVKVQGTEQHGSMGVYATTFYKQDYTDCHSLLHAEDGWNYSFNEIERSNSTEKEELKN